MSYCNRCNLQIAPLNQPYYGQACQCGNHTITTNYSLGFTGNLQADPIHIGIPKLDLILEKLERIERLLNESK